MKTRITLALLIAALSAATSANAATSEMVPYSIDLAHHMLRFSLPSEIASQVSPTQIRTQFNPAKEPVRASGFLSLAEILYDFNGPFWRGAYGSLKFHVMIKEKSPDYKGEISSAEELQKYLIWRYNKLFPNSFIGCSRHVQNSQMAILSRFFEGDKSGAGETSLLEIISMPLTDRLFIDVGIDIIQWEPGEGKKKWREKAAHFKDAINQSIILEALPPES